MARDLVDKLLTGCLDQPATEWHEHIDGLCREHPDQAGEIRRRFGRLLELGIVDPPGAADMHPAPERLGHFRLLRRVGGGGMGVVYEAHDEKLDRRVALKVIRREYMFFDGSRERFGREVLAASRLDHPNICPVYEAGELGGVPYLAMRFVDGPSLADVLERRRQEKPDGSSTAGSQGRRLDQVALVEKLARALHAAHEAGLIHRDVKPGNVLIDGDDEPVLVDFGLARDTGSDRSVLTRTGERLGTPAYMAPEQVSGGDVDRRADVHALGALLYECLTLRCPFTSRAREDLYRKILTEPPTNPRALDRSISGELRVVLERALQKRPADRFSTAAEMADELRRIRNHEPIQSQRSGLGLRTLRWCQRNRVASGVFAATLVGLLTSVWFVVQMRAANVTARVAGLIQAASNESRRNPQLALALAREAHRLAPSNETFAQLHESLFEHREIARFPLHDAPITEAHWSPDGDRFLTASRDRSAAVWDGATGAKIARFEHPAGVTSAAFDPGDPDRVVTLCENGKVYLWRLGDLAPEREWVFDPQARNRFAGVAFSDCGQHIATSTHRGAITVWDVEGNRVAWQVKTDKSVPTVAFAPGSTSRLLTAGLVGRIRVWDLATDAPIVTPEYPLVQINDAAWSPDGGHFVTAGHDLHAVVWTAAGVPLQTLSGHDGPVTGADFSPADDSRWLATASRDHLVRVFDRRTERATIVLRGHDAIVNSVEFSPDGQRLLSADRSGVVRVWALHPCTPDVIDFYDHPSTVCEAVSLPATGEVISAGFARHMVVWDPRSGAVIERIPVNYVVQDLFVGSNGKRLVRTDQDPPSDYVEVLDTERWEVIATTRGIGHGGVESGARWSALAPDGTTVVGIASGTRAATAYDLRAPRVLWSRVTKRPETPTDAYSGTDITLSPRDSGVVVTTAFDAALVLDLATGDEVRRFSGHRGLTSLAFSPAGDRLLTGATDAMARLWDFDSERLISQFAHRAPITAVAYDIDGTRVAAGDNGGEIAVWNLDGERVATLRGHRSTVRSLEFIEVDGRTRLLSASTDGRIRTWITEASELLAVVDRRLGDEPFEPAELEPYASLLGSRIEALGR